MTGSAGSQKGFTLLELLIALTIFAVGLLSIAQMQDVAIQGNSTSNVRTEATSLAQGILENILMRSTTDSLFSSDTSTGNSTSTGDPPWTSYPMESVTNYTATYQVRTNKPVQDVAKITVTVNGPQNRQVTIVGYKRTN